jgi:hypothetical protein
MDDHPGVWVVLGLFALAGILATQPSTEAQQSGKHPGIRQPVPPATGGG